MVLRVLGSWLPGRFALLGRRLARARMDAPVDTVVWGQRLRLHPNRSISEARILFMPWHWDHVERGRLRPWVGPGFVFVDVGANVGGYAFWISSLTGSEGRIVAVEPDPALARQLRFNARANGAEARVRIVEAAVGRAPGEGLLIRNPVNSGENRLARERGARDAGGDAVNRRCNPERGAAEASARDAGRDPADAPDSGNGSNPARRGDVVPVRVRTLLEIVEEAGLDRIDCLKVDVEGHEPDVLEPFLADAPEHLSPTLMLVEMKPGAASRAMESWILERGYRLECRTPLNGLFRRVGASAPVGAPAATGVPPAPGPVRHAVPASSPALRAPHSAPSAPGRSTGTGPS